MHGDTLAAGVDPEKLIMAARVRPEACPSATPSVGRERPDPDAADDDLVGRVRIEVPHDHQERSVEAPPQAPDDYRCLPLCVSARAPCGEI